MGLRALHLKSGEVKEMDERAMEDSTHSLQHVMMVLSDRVDDFSFFVDGMGLG